MTRNEFHRPFPRLVAAPPAGTEVRALGLDASPSAVEPAPDSPAARAAVAAFDWSEQAQKGWEDARQLERMALRQQAAQAVAGNDQFLALTNPTNAQVRVLTRQSTALIRWLTQID